MKLWIDVKMNQLKKLIFLLKLNGDTKKTKSENLNLLTSMSLTFNLVKHLQIMSLTNGICFSYI